MGDGLAGFILMFLVGGAGYMLFRYIRVPNPALLGSMVATGMVNIAGYHPGFPTWLLSFCANAAIGIMIGKEIDRTVFQRMLSLAKPVLIQLAGIFTLSLLCGFSLYFASGSTEISLLTALISGAAGGITEMIIFGLSMDADVAVIAFVQLIRVVTFLSLIPYIAVICEKLGKPRVAVEKPALDLLPFFLPWHYAVLIVAGFIGAGIGEWLSIPSGGLMGGMVAGGAVAMILHRRYKFDNRLRVLAQIALGLVMGQRLTADIVHQLWAMLLPTVVVTLVMLAGCIGLAMILHASTGWDYTTCLLCSAPAGLNQITVFADEIGVDSFTASIFHAVRIIGIVTIYPWIVLPVSGWVLGSA